MPTRFRRSHFILPVVVLVVLPAVLAFGRAREARAQEAGAAALGGSVGLLAGAYVSVGIWTAKAHFFDDYLYSIDDAVGWESIPVVAGAATGVTLGLTDRDRLENVALGTGAGFLVGTGVGLLIGSQTEAPSEGRWAGAVIGGSAGIVVGSLVGLLWKTDDDASPGGSGGRPSGVPLGVRIRF